MLLQTKIQNSVIPPKRNLAIANMFFMLGLTFGSLSSRMVSIKGELSLSDSVFGTLLFAMSAGVVLSLPISGWVIAKLGSRTVGSIAIIINAILLSIIPFAENVYQLAVLLFVSGFSYSAVNVSNNTQASISEGISAKTQLPFFHGVWGVAGFLGAGFGALMIGKNIDLWIHFTIITSIVCISILIFWRSLHNTPSIEQRGSSFAKPDKTLFNYGLIVFCSMACEGIMYDWSTIYFQDVLSAKPQFLGLGFIVFMGAMTIGRLILNRIVDRIGLKKTLQFAGGLAFVGFAIVIILPSLVSSLIAFGLIGLGICAVIPLIAGAAAKSSTLAPSSAIASVLTIGFMGTLIGPPLIGFLSEAFGLQYAFIVCAVLALGIIYRAQKIPAAILDV